MTILNNEKIEDLLLKLIEDMAYVKSKLESIEGQNFGSRIDEMEAQNERHESKIKSLENRCNTVEQFLRDNMQESKKQMVSVWISLGMAVFSVVLSFITKLF